MNKELREYVCEYVKNNRYKLMNTATEIINRLDNAYDEAIDFAANDLILCGEIDTMITDADTGVFIHRDYTIIGKTVPTRNSFTVIARSAMYGDQNKVVHCAHSVFSNLHGFLVNFLKEDGSLDAIQFEDYYTLELMNAD